VQIRPKEIQMKRTAITALVACLAAASMTGCGLASQGTDQTEMELAVALTPEGMALTALGYDPHDLAAADPVAAGDPEPTIAGPRWRSWQERRAARITMRQNMLHGEVVINTADGVHTVLVQRGVVTSITGTTLTVTSEDGHVQSWALGDHLRVIESRTTITARELTPGVPVGVAGTRVHGEPVAQLVVVPHPR
jgi:hypothetical protein